MKPQPCMGLFACAWTACAPPPNGKPQGAASSTVGTSEQHSTTETTDSTGTTAPPSDTADTDPWPDARPHDSAVVSLVANGAVVTDGEVFTVETAPAGLPIPTSVTFVLTNRSAEPLTLPTEAAAWLSDSPFTLSAPPATLAPEESATLTVTLDPSTATSASHVAATLTIPVPDGPVVTLDGAIPAPLRIVVTGSGHYTAISDDYGLTFVDAHTPAADDLTLNRDVSWGEGRFFRSDKAGSAWTDPGSYQWSDDGVTWTESATSSEFWVSDCTYANERFVCVRGSNWTWSESGETVLHNSGSWASMFNALTWVPGEEVGRIEDTAAEALLPGDRFVAVGRDGRRVLSEDGETDGVSVGSTITDYWNGVAYGNGLVVAVGGNNRYATAVSADGGETWTETTFCDNQYTTFTSVVYGDGTFLASGQSNLCGEVFRSTDGVNWTTTSTTDWRVVAFVNGWFIAIRQPWRAVGTIGRSRDGETWELTHTVPEGVTLQAAATERWETE